MTEAEVEALRYLEDVCREAHEDCEQTLCHLCEVLEELEVFRT